MIHSRNLILILVMPILLKFNITKGVNYQSKKITLQGTDIPLGVVFENIQKQTGLSVEYNLADIKLNTERKFTVAFRETALEEVMNFLLVDQKELKYTINNRYILIYRRALLKTQENENNLNDSIPVVGKVTDVSGHSIPGATIRVKGTRIGTTTDNDGIFKLPNVSKGEIVTISSVGFSSKDIAVNNNSIHAQLNPYVNSLDETVVIAYGTTTKRMSTSNVSTIKSSDIEKQPVNSPLLALQGRVPGLLITQTSGVTGSGVKIRIQGQNSISSGNDPLIIVDGMPYPSQLLVGVPTTILGQSGGDAMGNPLNFINPLDIESIDVLKDADATAIYGSRAANGAILITTKKGLSGTTKVNLRYQNGWGKISKKVDLLQTSQYIQMRKEAIKNDNNQVTPYDYDINGVWDTTRYTDWQKELIGSTANFTNISSNVSGGTGNIQYLVGANYSKSTTVFPGDFQNQQGSVMLNLNSLSANKKFHFQFSGSYLKADNDLPTTDFTELAIRLAPTAPQIYDNHGNINWQLLPNGISTFDNPLASKYNTYNVKTSNLLSSLVLSYQVIPGLNIKSNFGYNDIRTDEILLKPLIAYQPDQRPYNFRNASYSNGNISSWSIEPQVTYQHTISKGILDILVGSTIQQQNRAQQVLNGGGYNSDAVMKDIKSASVISVASTLSSIYKYNALFGRLNYTWQDKYIIDLNARRDGSSRFGAESQFHNFGAIGAAWIFSNEDFIQSTLPIVSFGKIKLSYGTSGNDQIPDYAYLNLYEPSTVSVPYQGVVGLNPVTLSNPYLEWEETKKINAGIELGVLHDRILVSANYYQNRSSNQLLSYQLPIFAGFRQITKNLPATVQNSGVELSVNSTNLRKNNFTWESSFNLTIPQNKLISFPNLENTSYASSLVIGQSIISRKLVHVLGTDSATGAYLFQTSKGTSTLTPNSTTDRTELVNTFPTFFGGLENTFRYRNITLSFLLQFVKQKGRDYSLGNVPGIFSYNQPVSVLSRWEKPGDNAKIQRFNSNYTLFRSFNDAYFNGDAAWADASYIRLKNIAISWTIPEKWGKKLHLQNFSVFMNAQNVFTITNYLGLDPETMSSTTLPPLSMYTFGLQVSL